MGPAPQTGKQKENQVRLNIQELWGNYQTSTRRMGQKSVRKERKKYVKQRCRTWHKPGRELEAKGKLQVNARCGCKWETPCGINLQTKLTALTTQPQLWLSYKRWSQRVWKGARGGLFLARSTGKATYCSESYKKRRAYQPRLLQNQPPRVNQKYFIRKTKMKEISAVKIKFISCS